VAAVLYVVLDRATATEQALSPGQDSFGVAVLAMVFGPAIVAAGGVGLLSLLVGMTVLTFHRLRNPN
jgi:hypothetical protein